MDKRVRKDRQLQKLYGITLKEYEELVESQGSKCAICRKHKSNFKRSLAVDHDHKTGEIRGALCFYCNKRFVGRHTRESVVKLVDYLLPEFILVPR